VGEACAHGGWQEEALATFSGVRANLERIRGVKAGQPDRMTGTDDERAAGSEARASRGIGPTTTEREREREREEGTRGRNGDKRNGEGATNGGIRRSISPGAIGARQKVEGMAGRKMNVRDAEDCRDAPEELEWPTRRRTEEPGIEERKKR